jgi:predicted MFS family arabinose efflux permease
LGNWRWTFGFVAVVAAACAIGVAVLLPPVPAGAVSSLRARFVLLGQVSVLGNLVATLLWITGAFVLYTFVTPLLTAATGWHGPAISMLLFLYGGSAFAGNALGGRAADRWGAVRTVSVGLASLVVSMSAAGWAAHLGATSGTVVALIALIAWPLAGWALTPAQSHQLVSLTPTAGAEVLSLNTTAVYLGIASGAALGGLVVRHASVAWLGPCAAVFQLGALLVVLVLRTKRFAVSGGPTRVGVNAS